MCVYTHKHLSNFFYSNNSIIPVIFVKNDKDYKRDGGSTYIPACGKY